MLQLKNETPFATSFALLPDRDGIDTLHAIVKATLTLKPKLALATIQVPVTLADQYYDAPENSSIKLASEMHIGKPGTDVLLMGSAHAIDGREITESTVVVSAAGRVKEIRIYGDRHWEDGGAASSPLPFTSMPLVWERAYGGVHSLPDRVFAEERNPIGIGFPGKRSASEMAGQPVPNLEDPASPVSNIGDAGIPACFAPTCPAWLPRRNFAGTYDAAWQRSRAPYLPADFDARFFMCAVPELAFEQPLMGGEPFIIDGVHPEGRIAFALPATPLDVDIKFAGAFEHPPVHLETVLIAPDVNLLCLTWRAQLAVDRKALKVDTIHIQMQRRGSAQEAA